MTFQQILDKYRKISFSEKDKGLRFERLMQAYLQTDPLYADRFSDVWLWNDFPARKDFGGNDTGIDLVARTHTGEYWAIQCKCVQDGTIVDKPALDSFLSTSGRSFNSIGDMKSVHFAQRLWISTTNKWGPNAEEAIKNQSPPFARLDLNWLKEAAVDWEKLEAGLSGEQARSNAPFELRPHQQDALSKTHEAFKTENRGKLIMACGTGKTFTALRIAENETQGKGLVLFMVPSIALLGQTLREWYNNAQQPISAICICSDAEVTRQRKKLADTDSFSTVDLAVPASTNVASIVKQFQALAAAPSKGMTVVFSTYQSINVIAEAQQALQKSLPQFGGFDLIICDEAHRTTGVSIAGADESNFTKVHNNDFIRAKKRLYMTATPRLYNDETKSKAAQNDALLCSMDDESLYGPEMYRIGFGEAVEKGLLTDYKVLILTLSEQDVPPAIQKMIAGEDNEIDADDASRLIGCVNALSKQILGDEGIIRETDPEPMRRAVAFCSNIAASRKITSTFNSATDTYIDALPEDKRNQMIPVQSQHIDGTMNAPRRDELLGWLKAETSERECRVLTNVRCLSEGVDVPSLDAVLFLSARNSQVDVVQSVGRVMRRAPGKKYGYIIIPVVVPSTIDAAQALDDNDRYRVVWTVLNALRAHDDRFNATVNKIELNKKRPAQILIGRPDTSFPNGEATSTGSSESATQAANAINEQLAIQFEQLQSVVFARMVNKVGDRTYWEQWAKSIAGIAERQVTRITELLNSQPNLQKAFDNFLGGLRHNINPGITQQQAIEMLSQHIITKPVFEALFEGYSFVQNNPISVSMQQMLDLLNETNVAEETALLQKFYESVKVRASGIDNAEGKQRIIIELYDKFFKTAFPKMVEQLGIVYTPVEVVDFILHSVDDVLHQEFGRRLTDENVHILDPFTGTGTFITRLLQSGLIKPQDLARKYQHELHANEIVLLAYYIAAVNIENAFHDAAQTTTYDSFEGICLTDTFQLAEPDGRSELFKEVFPQNTERVSRQRKAPLRVIIGNPPYSIGQKSANDNAQNQAYPALDARIASTYAQNSSAGLSKSLYDAYIKAFRWSTDQLDETGGIICFVSNGAWLDGNSTDGFRKSLQREFSTIYVFNLRGNQRTSGELSRKEGGKIFGSGSRTPITVTLLVKNPQAVSGSGTVHYHDIGDYLTRETKLDIVKSFRSIGNTKIPWQILLTNEHGDWLAQRTEVFDTFIPLAPEKKFDLKSQSIFTTYAVGVATARDAWTYNSSIKELECNMRRMIDFYNEQQKAFSEEKKAGQITSVDKFLNMTPTKISWSVNLKKDVEKGVYHKFKNTEFRIASYRPFSKQNLYYDKPFIERRGISSMLFPNSEAKNIIINVPNAGVKDFYTLVTDTIRDYDTYGGTQTFPLYYFEERPKQTRSLFDEGGDSEFIRRDGISDFILTRAKQQYGKNVIKEDIFYYVYGLFHSPTYRETFADDLKKMLPRLPLLDDVRQFWAFSKAGRQLAALHLDYEQVAPLSEVQVAITKPDHYTVDKMRFPKKGQRDTILYNSYITVSNIPAAAYDYTVNGKSAIEWIMERYQVTTHKDSGITNNPNDWATEHNQPRYILDLLLSVIALSIQTVEIVAALPEVKFE
ncbi:DEAD/DEAH box helicase [Hymenobacter terrestris]|uniref:DEAD/DEAH box helicase n=1 Tax=Hymenobacter terrestris TaxID=2748310 RepID=A0ABX2Q169_9BACT|nr:type ISP restriction/modification enzyme [Hymenobacter terrestris]NVO84279.1 DEAD/DEAH box helicase [Hymenobacter terrestris]